MLGGGICLRKKSGGRQLKNILLNVRTANCRRKAVGKNAYTKGRLNILRFFAYISNLIFCGFFDKGFTISLWSFSPKPDPLAGELPVIVI